MPLHLADIFPSIPDEQIMAQLVPPPTFDQASFDNYIPDPHESSQKAALDYARKFTSDINAPTQKKKFWMKKKISSGQGLYLDGGFGVGKTHLLAAIYGATSGKKIFGSFAEYTQLIGIMGFTSIIDFLSDYSLICIDEFELDDPGDTMQMSRLLDGLSARGVNIAVTSNTLPGQLGEGRFAAKDFYREIQKISHLFHTLKVDGPDYRHRELSAIPEPSVQKDIELFAHKYTGASLDSFDELLEHLRKIHPAKYKKLVNDIFTVCITQMHPLSDQGDALRLVMLVDRLYDDDIPILGSGCSLDKVFTSEMMAGGYRKKYLRALSRMFALNRKGLELLEVMKKNKILEFEDK